MIKREDWMIQLIGYLGQSFDKSAIETIGNYCYDMHVNEVINK